MHPDSNFNERLTPHFQLGEMALWQEARRFHHQHQVETAIYLCTFLEQLRQWAGHRPVKITSGFRPEPINRFVGGAVNSEHLFSGPGTGAVDVHVPGMNLRTVEDWVAANWRGSVGKGARLGFIHVGLRDGRRGGVWAY